MSTSNAVVDREAWHAARLDHLAAEKEFTRARDELSRQRRGLPWLEISEDYRFDGPDGEVSLADLFDGREQLIVQHFMMGPGWEEGCPSCSYWADGFDGITVHLEHRNTSFAVVSRATLPEIDAYKTRMGWDLQWLSSHGSSFNYDLGASATPEQIEAGEAAYNFGTQTPMGEESAGLSTFRQQDGKIFLTYQTFSRGLDMLNTAYHLLDLTSMGRDEDSLPWGMAWLHRHDAYPG
ncbi:MAG: putative dithiol-disulfide oxidoreductase (DUF899 family) [Verrucomicrobiales bacterium]|jgi:predicted dithiol-disulfide oxidoreductase (DUF899 family)